MKKNEQKTNVSLLSNPKIVLVVSLFNYFCLIFCLFYQKARFLILLPFLVDIIFIIFSEKRLFLYLSLIPVCSLCNMNIGPLSFNYFHVLSVIVLCLNFFFYFKKKKNTREGIKKVLVYSLPLVFYLILEAVNSFIGFVNNITNFDVISIARDCVYFLIAIFYCLMDDKSDDNLVEYFSLTFSIVCILSAIIFIKKPNVLFGIVSSNPSGQAYDRFRGFDWDPNFFSLYAIFVDLLFIKYIKSASVKRPIFVISVIAINLVTLLTGSKMFLLSLILFIIELFYIRFKNSKKTLFVAVLSLMVVIPFGTILLKDYLLNFINQRVLLDGSSTFGESLISKVSTGRTTIFAEYSDFIFSNPLISFFGLNGSRYLINGNAIHNTFAYSAYSCGIFFGALLIVSYYFLCFKKFIFISDNKKANLLHLFIFVIVLNSLNLFISHNAFLMFLILANKSTNKQNREITI